MRGWSTGSSTSSGRHGVLGDVDPDVILAAAFFFPADHLRREWGTARALMTPAEGLSRYLAVCHQWGRDRLAGFAEADRLSELGQKVIEASDVVGLPLFAGWRAVPLPAAGARPALSAAPRSCRCCASTAAPVTASHSPRCGSIRWWRSWPTKAGEENAREYGWEPPFPEVTDADRALRARVEELTDDLVAPAYDGLTPDEQAELVEPAPGRPRPCLRVTPPLG